MRDGRRDVAEKTTSGEARREGKHVRKRKQESVEQRVRRLVRARWESEGGEEARLRDVWVDAGEEGISVKEVSRVVRLMEQANELMDRDGTLHRL